MATCPSKNPKSSCLRSITSRDWTHDASREDRRSNFCGPPKLLCRCVFFRPRLVRFKQLRKWNHATKLNRLQRAGHKRFDTNHLESTRIHRFQQSLESGSGPGGRWFKSTRPDHSFQRVRRRLGRPAGFSPGVLARAACKNRYSMNGISAVAVSKLSTVDIPFKVGKQAVCSDLLIAKSCRVCATPRGKHS